MAAEDMLWGTYGKGGFEHCTGLCPEHKLRFVRLGDCETEHLQAILRTQELKERPEVVVAIYKILSFRGITPQAFSSEAAEAFSFESLVGYLRYRHAN